MLFSALLDRYLDWNAILLKKRFLSLEGQIMKLRLQYIGHLMRREDSLEKTLMVGKCEGKRRRG